MHKQNIKSASSSTDSKSTFSHWPPGRTIQFIFEAPEFGLIEQLLDVGGGSGMMASLVKRHNPHIKITVFDHQGLCDAAMKLFRENAQSDDLGAHAGNMHTDPFPSGFEAIQLSGLPEDMPAGRVKALLHKASNALPAGGLLLIYAPMATTGALEYRGSRTARQYQEWLKRQGLTPVACRQCAGRYALISAFK